MGADVTVMSLQMRANCGDRKTVVSKQWRKMGEIHGTREKMSCRAFGFIKRDGLHFYRIQSSKTLYLILRRLWLHAITWTGWTDETCDDYARLLLKHKLEEYVIFTYAVH